MQRHLNDPYVKKATGQGYRSRAVYKLQEIDQQDNLLAKASLVADLGAAPGGWSQYIARNYPKTTLIALDLLPMEPIDGVQFVQGDFTDPDTTEKLVEATGDRQFDLVISDMAPNITGIRDVDAARYEGLLESVLYFCENNLKPGGHLLVKLFEGRAAQLHREQTRRLFQRNMVRKPQASRSNSKEFYYLSMNHQVK